MIWTKDKLWELKEMYENPFNNTKEIAEHFDMNVRKLYNLAHKKRFVRGAYQEFGYQKCSTCKQILEANSDNFYANKNIKMALVMNVNHVPEKEE